MKAANAKNMRQRANYIIEAFWPPDIRETLTLRKNAKSPMNSIDPGSSAPYSVSNDVCLKNWWVATEMAKRLSQFFNHIMQRIKCEDDFDIIAWTWITKNDSPIIHHFIFHYGCFGFMKYYILLRTYLSVIIVQLRNQTKFGSNFFPLTHEE